MRHAAKFNKPHFDLFDYRVVALAGDGCLQDRPDVFFFVIFDPDSTDEDEHDQKFHISSIEKYVFVWPFFPTVVHSNKSTFQREKVSNWPSPGPIRAFVAGLGFFHLWTGSFFFLRPICFGVLSDVEP